MKKVLTVLTLLSIIVVAFFYKLDAIPWYIWDESRLAANAYEMFLSGNFIVTTYDQLPDMWNTKPPLMIWSQVLSISFFGLNEWSTRLPAALAASITLLLVFYFTRKVTQSTLAGLFSAIVLATANGYIGSHGVRWGEYDAYLALFTTLYILFFYAYVKETGEKQNVYLFLFFVSLTAACLTKGIAGMLFTPILFLYLLINRRFLDTLRNLSMYSGAALFLVLVLGFYVLRELYNPGYIQAVYDNELGGRFNKAAELHTGPFDFYYQGIRGSRFDVHYWIFLTSLVALIFTTKKIRSILIFLWLCSVWFLLVISKAETKLMWYDIPLYPLFAIMGGLSLWQLMQLAKSFISYQYRPYLFALLIIVFSTQPVKETLALVNQSPDQYYEASFVEYGFYDISLFMRNPLNEQKIRNSTYFSHGYDYQWKLQMFRLKEKGLKIRYGYVGTGIQFSPGEIVFTHQWVPKQLIEEEYNFEKIDSFRTVMMYKIINKK